MDDDRSSVYVLVNEIESDDGGKSDTASISDSDSEWEEE